ncbi:MAG TPA: PDZ domain-containing protein [Acidobacteriota bacterium]|nr:PDZ domain-containing protein [Acidobacteriota bacterium]
MLRYLWIAWVALSLVAAQGTSAAAEADEIQPHAGMLRYPDISAELIVFVYANDIWVVSREGGLARPLASPPGPETFPRFAPDGDTIAFVGNYEGNRDLYTIAVEGAIAKRVTYHPATEVLSDWTPEGRLLFATEGFSPKHPISHLFTVSTQGGLPQKLPLPWGSVGAVSPDGAWLAYTPHTRDSRPWKRYRGGMATDIWLFNLNDRTSKKVTGWEGTDTRPMWHGNTLYYLSDAAPSHRLNLFAYDTASGRTRQLTEFADRDVKWPSIGPGPNGDGEIVFQYGSRLMVLDLGSEETRTVEVSVPGDRPEIRSKIVEAEKYIQAQSISPTGKRALFSARGDIWTVPAEKGSPRNLTRSDGAAERYPAWSPDGRWIAYFADNGGEYDLYLRRAGLHGDSEKVTSLGPGYRFRPFWCPDSSQLVFRDEKGQLLLFDLEKRNTKVIDTDPSGSGPAFVSWSHDSTWLAFSRQAEETGQSAIFLHHVPEGTTHQVTSGYFTDTWPVFDRQGKYLYFASNRQFTSAIGEDFGGTDFVYTQTDRLLVVPLRKDVSTPMAPKSDEEEFKEEEAGEEKGEDSGQENGSQPPQGESPQEAGQAGDPQNNQEGEEKDSEEPLAIELEGFETRAVLLPVKRGSFGLLAVNHKGQLLYRRRPIPLSGGGFSINLFDPNQVDKKEQTVLKGAAFFELSADGKSILVQQGSRRAILEAAPNQKMEKTLDLQAMSSTIRPPQEWRQIFLDAWRFQRDFFYAPNMHGVDWQRVRRNYEAMLPDCLTRSDVSYVIAEMIAELNVGHAYNFGGDTQDQPSRSVGMLGVDFALADGAYQIARILEGAPWDSDARNPLRLSGAEVKEGDYLLAVNGVKLDTAKDPWAAFQGLAGKTVILTISDKPQIDDESREVPVELLSSERNLRFRHWIEQNRRSVEEKSDGKVGYVYVPDTGPNGRNNLYRQFFGQRRKAALIIDERWNGGGNIPTRFVELLNRPVTNYWARRHGEDLTWPPDAHHGPKAMLINGLAGSGGDAFPAYFKQAGLGPLIGTRTWGGLVGYSGAIPFVDGGATTSPSFAYYETDGTWGIEGHGVDPDLEVLCDPAEMQDGSDPQIDAAVEYLLAEIRRRGDPNPERPPYPDRSGMGIPETDK